MIRNHPKTLHQHAMLPLILILPTALCLLIKQWKEITKILTACIFKPPRNFQNLDY